MEEAGEKPFDCSGNTKCGGHEWELEEFVGNSLDQMTDVDNVLRLLNRFEKLNLECLHLDERYLEAMIMFQGEIEVLRDRYNEERQSPLIPRNMPPVSGRIMWIRHFYKRIEEPMVIFKTKPRVVQHEKYRNAFNFLMQCPWYLCNTKIFIIKHGSPLQDRIQINGGIAVPDVGQVLVFCKEKLLNSYEVIKSLITRNDSIRTSIPSLFLPLMRTQLIKMENVFMPGFSTITWTSMKIPEFCQDVTNVLDYIETFAKEVRDMKEARIDEVLENLANTTSVVYLPIDAICPSDFLEENIKYRLQIGIIDQPDLQENKYNWLDPEKAVKPIGSTSKLLSSENTAFKEIDRNVPLDLVTLHSDCIEMFAFFNMKLIDSLIKCTKLSLEKLKQRAVSLGEFNPLMKTNMILQIPLAVIIPSLDEVQSHFAQVLNNVLETHKYIGMWGQLQQQSSMKGGGDEIKPKQLNYFKTVSENKEVMRIYMGLQGVMYLVNPDILALLEKYLEYNYLWVEDRDQQLENFCETNPLIVEISERFQSYDDRAESIRQLPDYHNLGAVQIRMELFKLALLVESDAWKHTLGKKLGERYKEKLTNMVDFIKSTGKNT
ncbi:hypothetical protein NQ317_010573 [Molorchus minor]|uniref:Dynein heavy chain tail domain-containing protein n=1 Tax=Molorchus minor TaxID=1323400 RepID=A0ABQ9IRJ1_9CUCU|nr:hypothetical protein NQ317_010573 [Molorchus minor]